MGKLYPVGIQNFESLRNDGYFYVDKTELMYRLVKTGRYYFLSRPRRFGKSLLISTLEAYFQGKKELFEGLAVHGLENEWAEYPILHLDLNTRKYDTPEALDQELSKHLEQWEKEYGDEYSGRAVEERFYHIIRMAYEKTGRRVVILVDEYDKPMLQAIGDDVLQDRYRSTLKAFYGALKSQDGYIKFALLTGVTKFGKVSVFSDLNNLMDISRDERYTDICGISEKELLDNFSEDIRDLALANGQTFEQACAQLKEDYDGYHFCPDSAGIYNPFSLLNTFAKRRQEALRELLVRDGDPDIPCRTLEKEQLRSGGDVPRGDQRGHPRQYLHRRQPYPCDLPERIPHYKGLRQGVRDVHPRIPQQGGGGRFHELPPSVLCRHRQDKVPVRDQAVRAGCAFRGHRRFHGTSPEFPCRLPV